MPKTSMTHARAVSLMILVTLLWSIAGVVTRHLDSAQSFEVTFWRSFFNALAMTVILTVLRGPSVWRSLLRSPRMVWMWPNVSSTARYCCSMAASRRTGIARSWTGCGPQRAGWKRR